MFDLVDYDVVVVGAGPAGSIAAKEIGESGYSVLLLDRDSEPGRTKLCGGMISYQGISNFTFPDWVIERKISGIRTILPKKGLREYDFGLVVGINVKREVLGKYLAQLAQKSGVHTEFGARVTKISNGKFPKVKYVTNSETIEISTKIIVGADGVFSLVARHFGIRKKFNDEQIGITAQREIYLNAKTINENFGKFNEFYYGHEFSPFGYGWVFPRSDSVVVGVGSLYSVEKRDPHGISYYLDAIIKHPLISPRLSEGRIGRLKQFFVPLSGPISPTFGNNFILVGDAAGHVSPISGEGIHFAMLGGRIAGQVVVESLKHDDFSAKRLGKYEKLWRKNFGSDLKWGLKLMKIFEKRGSKSLGSGFGSDKTSVRLIGELLYGIKPVKKVILSAIPQYVKWKIRKR